MDGNDLHGLPTIKEIGILRQNQAAVLVMSLLPGAVIAKSHDTTQGILDNRPAIAAWAHDDHAGVVFIQGIIIIQHGCSRKHGSISPHFDAPPQRRVADFFFVTKGLVRAFGGNLAAFDNEARATLRPLGGMIAGGLKKAKAVGQENSSSSVCAMTAPGLNHKSKKRERKL